MSRIIGVFSKHPGQNFKSCCHNILNASKGAGNWTVASHNLAALSWGWGGREPIKTASGDGIVIVLDGAIYNRNDLGKFPSDAELLISLYQQNGFEPMLKALNGDYALALYDSHKKKLWLARDRFGLKPLYYIDHKDYLAFGSRPSFLFTLPNAHITVNRRFVAVFAASHYRSFDNAIHESPYQEIAQLPAAHYLCFSDDKTSVSPYWSLKQEPDFTDNETALAEKYWHLLRDAVALRLNTAQKPAFTLSGGMDSSSVLAAAVDITKHKQFVFSSLYTDKTYDESAEIRSMLPTHVEKWHPVEVGNPDVFALIEQMIAVHDEPVATATWLSHFLLCEEASRKGFHSLFGGLGGDELNAGEYEHFFYFFADLRLAGLGHRLSEEIKMWIQYHDHPIFKKSPAFVEEQFKKIINFKTPGQCLPDQNRLNRYAGVLNPEYYDLRSFQQVMDHPFLSYLKNRTYHDLSRETVPCCLRAEDRQTVAFGMDNFLPFLDHRLVEFMFRVPGTLKYDQGVTKHLLRQATKGKLPEETRTRVKKTGWNAPAHMWFSGKGRERLLDIVNSQDFRSRGIYNIPEVLRLIDEHERIVSHQENRDNHMMFLWQLINLELWFKSLK